MIQTIDRLWAITALFAGAAVIIVSMNWWVMGPGTQSPINGYRFPLFEFNREMRFGNSENLFALASGWREPEASAVWSRGNHAELAFRLPNEGLTTESKLILHLYAFLAPPKLTAQHISVREGEVTLGHAVVTTSDVTLNLSLSGIQLPHNPTPILLQLDLPDTTSPFDAEGHGSHQPTAVGLISLEITR